MAKEKSSKGMELIVPTESIINEKDFGSFKIADTETGILFHIKGGYDIFVQPRMASLYQHLKYLLDNYDESKNWDENEKEIFDLVFNSTITNLEIPLFMANDQKALFDIAAVALTCLNDFAKEAMSAALKAETPQENGEFQRAVDAMEEVNQTS